MSHTVNTLCHHQFLFHTSVTLLVSIAKNNHKCIFCLNVELSNLHFLFTYVLYILFAGYCCAGSRQCVSKFIFIIFHLMNT